MSENILKINQHHLNQRVDNYLFSKFKFIPKSKIYSAIRKGEIRINSKRVKPSTKLKFEDLVRVPPNFINSDNSVLKIKTAKQMDLPVIFEDDDFIVIDKPVGVSAHSGTKNSYGVIELCREQFKNTDLDLCHRIDKATSGIILISKHKSFLRYFHKQLRELSVSKEYLAIVHGDRKEKLFTVHDDIELKSGQKKEALSEFSLLGRNKKYTLYSIKIDTGRMHQIRIHCSGIDMPILNDKKYGNFKLDKKVNISHGFNSMALHSHKISFLDSAGKKNSFFASTPDSWKKFLTAENIVVNL